MGGLHPRAKQTIGRRLALAAAHVAYNQKDVPFTGPVLKSCTVLNEGARCLPNDPHNPACSSTGANNGEMNQREIMFEFDDEMLGDDAVHVWPTAPDTEGLTIMAMYNCLNGTCLTECNSNSNSNSNGGGGGSTSTPNTTCAEACILNSPTCRLGLPVFPIGPSGNGGYPTQYEASHLQWKTARTVSPLEVQFNNTIWMPASISFNAGHTQNDQVNRNCHPDPAHPSVKPCTNWTKAVGSNTVVGVAPVSIPLGCGDGMDARTGRHNSCPPPDQLNGRWCENCAAYFQITGAIRVVGNSMLRR
jgi:hypothetical protein